MGKDRGRGHRLPFSVYRVSSLGLAFIVSTTGVSVLVTSGREWVGRWVGVNIHTFTVHPSNMFLCLWFRLSSLYQPQVVQL